MDIYIDQIIEASPFSHKQIARHLYPDNAYPDAALKRVSEGTAKLDSAQISKLSALTGIGVGLLFTKDKWRRIAAGRKLMFQKERYSAIYNTETKVVTVLEKGSVFHEDIIGGGSMPLCDLLKLIDELIKEKGQGNGKI